MGSSSVIKISIAKAKMNVICCAQLFCQKHVQDAKAKMNV